MDKHNTALNHIDTYSYSKGYIAGRNEIMETYLKEMSLANTLRPVQYILDTKNISKDTLKTIGEISREEMKRLKEKNEKLKEEKKKLQEFISDIRNKSKYSMVESTCDDILYKMDELQKP